MQNDKYRIFNEMKPIYHPCGFPVGNLEKNQTYNIHDPEMKIKRNRGCHAFDL